MHGYREQTVSGERRPRQKFLYALCWVLVAALTLFSILCTALFWAGAETSALFGWKNLAAAAICLGLALVLWRFKDRVFVEYDYIYRDEALEIWIIYNRRKRRQMERIQMDWVRSIDAPPCPVRLLRGERREAWYVRSDALCCVHYIKDNIRRAALLELNAEMRNALRNSKRLERSV